MDQVSVRYMTTPETVMDGIRAVADSQSTPTLRAGSLLGRLCYLSWIGMGIYFLISPPKDRAPGTPSLAVPPLTLGAFILGLDLWPKLSRRRAIRRRILRMPEKERWVSWSITPDDVEIRDHLTTTRLKWARFAEVVEHNKGFLFLFDAKQGSFLPAVAFTWPEEARFVSDWARRRVAKYRKKSEIEVEVKSPALFTNDEL
jgi:hypothetical protein